MAQNFSPEDLAALISSAFPTTKPSASEAKYAPAEATQDHLQKLEARIKGIEHMLSNILEHISLSAEDAQAGNSQETSRKNKYTISDSTVAAEVKPSGPYKYTPLDASKSQLRILRLHRAEELTDPLTANLETVGLDDNTIKALMYGFSALSYTWGPPVFDGLILVDGHEFPITRSLEKALRRLRYEYKDNAALEINGRLWGKECWIWVDQICINQADIDERGSQVGLMRRIYKKATSVHVWLGEEEDDSSMAIDLLNILGAPPKNAPGEKTIEYPTFTEDTVVRHWNALRALFKRPWWERVWVRQEVALPLMVKMWCGSKSFDLNSLAPALFMLKHISSLGYASTISHSDDETFVSLPWDFHAGTIAKMRQMTRNGSLWVGAAQLLRMTRAAKATDSRDTVFSILGMANPEVYSIVPDYRQEYKQILLLATQAAIKLEYGLEILGACQNPERKDGLPSWIPSLQEKWKAIPFQTTGLHEMRFISRLTTTELPHVHVKDEMLALQGGLIDTISSICPFYVHNTASASSLESVFQSWKAFAHSAASRAHLSLVNFETLIEGTTASQKAYYEVQRQTSQKDYDVWLVECQNTVTQNWIQFMTVMLDKAQDLQPGYQASRVKVHEDGPDAYLFDSAINPFGHLGLNPRLTRSYLLPPSHAMATPHPNHRVHAGLKMYGVGRRFCLTQRGYLALIPAEVRVGDGIALFKGATFPYVLRREGQANVLVGEAFVYGFSGEAWDRSVEVTAREEWGVGLDGWIWIF
ncbi:Heterokaryon incompatibility protein, putative [Glarea lozoyensis ATCC 20868]|uniref:Heterokaryon incompatibility protein, putative n=1 Tax=Glarea lozoyensis (strain ATCC 20868 / MF5171) TaxID=1116229 RepID=S3DMK6_GLAL2|nr:Heterokaryon incompatibility protein, putative [Glarea lozoyensis ATCC 20868]EPE33296.1 Heterokaryon incompatibility protein, putative [Glarea lozoyensis ATCC 20868]